MTGKSRIAPKFPRHLFFEGFLINNTELQDISTRIICMAILMRPKELWQNLGIKNTYIPGLFDKPSLFTKKINLKRPLSRGSQFKFYFYLGQWGNRGSHKDFHVSSSSKDCWLIILNYGTFQSRNKMHDNTNVTKELRQY